MSGRVVGNAVAFVAMMLWATQFPAMEHVMQTWQPILMTPLRLSASAICLLFLLLVTGRSRHIQNVPWRQVWILGGIALTASTVLFVWGQKYTHPVTAAIIVSMMPVMSVVMGYLQRREELSIPIGIGIVLAVFGGYLTALAPDQGWLSFHFRGGEPLLLAAIICFVWYTRETTHRLSGMSELAQAAFTLTFAALGSALFAVAAILLGYAEPVYEFSLTSVGIIAWVGGIAVGVSMVLWFTAARRIGVTVTTMHHNLVPFYVMVMAVATGGALVQTQAWGALLVCAGAVLAQIPVFSLTRRRQFEAP